jgi:hypothetical protein
MDSVHYVKVCQNKYKEIFLLFQDQAFERVSSCANLYFCEKQKCPSVILKVIKVIHLQYQFMLDSDKKS